MNTTTISRNTFWYGLEMAVGFISGLVTSVAIARVLGPESLGHLVFIGMLTTMASSIGSLGMPATASKYIAEYLGRGEPGIARAVFFATLRIQALLCVSITGITLVGYWVFAEQHHAVAALLIGSNVPYMLGLIAAQTNAASEDLMANVPGSLVSTLTYAAGVGATLTWGWGLIGLAGSVMASRTAEVFVRMIPTLRRVRQWPKGLLPAEVRARMLAFAKQSIVLLLLSVVVWDRSEMWFLKYFWNDIRQVAFYSVAFNLTEKVLVVSQVFGAATSATLMAQVGRNASLLGGLVSTAVRYHALIALPAHLLVSVLSGSLLMLLYGTRYTEAAPLLAIAVLFAIPKALLPPLSTGLAAKDRQSLVVRWMLLTAVFNVGADVLLIPRYGALGAVIGNGVAQAFAAIGLMALAARVLECRWPVAQIGKLGLCSAAMGLAVLACASLPASNSYRLVGAVLVAATTFPLMLRATRSLDGADRDRFRQIERRCPGLLRPIVGRGIGLLFPAAPG